MVAGGMIIFLAFEGFELIANSAQYIKDPAKTLPRAFYASICFVIVLYILIAIVTIGNLPLAKIIDAKDYALAEAAKPLLGQAGFILIAVAAMLSTASAINATVYGATRLSYIIAKDGELPEVLEKKTWNEPIAGLLITSVSTLFIANLFDLSSISIMGSAGFLLIFAAVNCANVKLAKQTKSKRWLSVLGAALCLFALASLIWQTAQRSPQRIWILVVMAGTAFCIEATFRLFTERKIRLPK